MQKGFFHGGMQCMPGLGHHKLSKALSMSILRIFMFEMFYKERIWFRVREISLVCPIGSESYLFLYKLFSFILFSCSCCLCWPRDLRPCRRPWGPSWARALTWHRASKLEGEATARRPRAEGRAPACLRQGRRISPPVLSHQEKCAR